MPDSMEQALTSFARDVHRVLGTTTEEQTIVDTVADRLRHMLADGFAVEAPYRAAHPDHYVMYPLYIAPDDSFCVASAVWGVGQRTPLHDHGVWGVVGIAEGVEHEERFAEPDGGEGPLVSLEVLDFEAGEVTVCCTTDRDVHRVSCGSQIPCIGIHVYGGDIWRIRRRSFDAQTGAVSYFTSAAPDVVLAVQTT